MVGGDTRSVDTCTCWWVVIRVHVVVMAVVTQCRSVVLVVRASGSWRRCRLVVVLLAVGTRSCGGGGGGDGGGGGGGGGGGRGW